MSVRTPVFRPISWLAVVPQLLAGGIAATIGYLLAPEYGVLYGIAVYLVYSIGSRQLIPRYHRAGIQLIRQQRFADAIPKFEASLAFFDRHPWVDRFRSVVLMSPSAMSYREMALSNIAFCYSQIGDGRQARKYYEQCLQRFPDSGIATTALRMMDAGAQAAVE